MKKPWGSTVLVVVLCLAHILEGLSLLGRLIAPPAPNGSFELFNDFDSFIFGGVSLASPALVLGVLYSPVLRHALGNKRTFKSVDSFIRKMAVILNKPLRLSANVLRDVSLLDYPVQLLTAAITSASLVVLLPYRPDLNPNLQLVGIDSALYVGWIEHMLGGSFGQATFFALTGASQGSKPLVLVLFYSIARFGRIQPDFLVRSSPVLLGPLLVFSTYFLVNSGSGNKRMAGVAAILTAFSPSITVGMWAGYYANWIALIESYLFLAVLLMFSRAASIGRYAALLILSLALLLTHPQTWILISALTGVFAVCLWKDLHRFSLTGLLISVVAVGLAVDLAKIHAFSSYGAASASLEILSKTASSPFVQLSLFWPSLVEAFTLNYDGLLANGLLIGLSLAYTVKMNFNDRFERLLIIWVTLSALPLLFVDGFLQSRIIYDLPLSLLASGGLTRILSRVGSRGILSNLILICIALFSANYTVRSLIQL